MVSLSPSVLIQEIVSPILFFAVTIFSKSKEDGDHLTKFHFLKIIITSHDPPGICFTLSSPERNPLPFASPTGFPFGEASMALAFPAYTGRSPELNVTKTLHQTGVIC